MHAPAAPLAVLSPWAIDGLSHGFMGRAGGVSTGVYASLNLAEWNGDEPAAVAENWRRWRVAYPRFTVARLSQVHGKLVHRVDASWGDARRAGDGMVTAAAGVALGIFSADCVPILMVDAERRSVGAVHAGWRGTIAGIAGEGVRAMAALGARPHAMRAALGPSIGLCCFEVDAPLADDFARQLPGAREHCRAGGPGKAYVDLRAIIRGQLERAGLDPAAIANVGPCTRCTADGYFSRRAGGGAVTGLQMSFVGFAR
ncbi:MAG: peptidoglycan editing factor PgeF [Candidatus Binataceae bacterium]|nr:peptidoglycan editing factor PgeF [Candidatus Binataceae bacterium]